MVSCCIQVLSVLNGTAGVSRKIVFAVVSVHNSDGARASLCTCCDCLMMLGERNITRQIITNTNNIRVTAKNQVLLRLIVADQQCQKG